MLSALITESSLLRLIFVMIHKGDFTTEWRDFYLKKKFKRFPSNQERIFYSDKILFSPLNSISLEINQIFFSQFTDIYN